MTDIFTKNFAPFLMCHMATFMVTGLIIISRFQDRFSKLTIRKLFHFLALLILLPGAVMNVKFLTLLIIILDSTYDIRIQLCECDTYRVRNSSLFPLK